MAIGADGCVEYCTAVFKAPYLSAAKRPGLAKSEQVGVGKGGGACSCLTASVCLGSCGRAGLPIP